ncbi:MAG: hypothetical protein O3B76_00050 [Proteobacteria bacterium]|nr:hypothetical protein [Pseudomonadota bacterium]MDA1024007.1 hypothetical protein [Pseudomonadota bacterium]
MSTLQHTIPVSDFGDTAKGVFHAVFNGIGEFLSSAGRAQAAHEAFLTLNNMSDAQLAKRNMTRNDINGVVQRILSA